MPCLATLVKMGLNGRLLFKFFATAPAWIIFSIFALPPFLFYMGVLLLIFFPQILPHIGRWAVLLWIYSISISLYEKYSQYLNIPLVRFKICLILQFLISILSLSDISSPDYFKLFEIISFICNIYSLYFISKLIVLIERKSEIKFQNYVGIIILFLFYFIGVWIIQPRVKKLIVSKEI